MTAHARSIISSLLMLAVINILVVLVLLLRPPAPASTAASASSSSSARLLLESSWNQSQTLERGHGSQLSGKFLRSRQPHITVVGMYGRAFAIQTSSKSGPPTLFSAL